MLAANYTHTVAVFLPLLFVLHVLIKRRRRRRTPGKASGEGDRKRKHNGASVSRGPEPLPSMLLSNVPPTYVDPDEAPRALDDVLIFMAPPSWLIAQRLNLAQLTSHSCGSERARRLTREESI